MKKKLFFWKYLFRTNIFDKGLFFKIAANGQTNERLSATESISNAIASSSSNTRTLTGNILNTINQTNLKNSTKIAAENYDGDKEQLTAEAGAAGGLPETNIDDDDLASVHLMLEPHLRPPPPDPKSDLSKEIFDEHKQLAKEYLKVSGFFR